MKKIKLDQKMLLPSGKPIKRVKRDENGKPVIVKGKQVEEEVTVRDYLLAMLSANFPIVENKEYFWTTELGILFSDKKKKEVEISDDKWKFLVRIIKNNKVKKPTPMGGTKEEEMFFPYEVGQLLHALGASEEELK